MTPYNVTIVIPDLRGGKSGVETHYEFLKRWEKDYAAGREAIEPLRNIRFKHDPDWRNRFWSIQSAHDGNHWVWAAAHTYTRGVMTAGLGLQVLPLGVL